MGVSGRRPVVVAHDVWLAAGLQRALPETAIVCVSASDAVDCLRSGGTSVFCLSEEIGAAATATMSSLELLQHPSTAAFFARLGPTAVLSFKPSERIAAAVAALRGDLLAAPTSAARAYENKFAFVGAAERSGVPRPHWDVRALDEDYATLADRFGPMFVVQGARGNAGRRTWAVHSQADIDALPSRERSGRVRVAEFVPGMPFTASGVAFSSHGTGLDQSHLPAVIEPCRQVTGVDWLTPEPLGSCGNAWGQPGLVPHVEEITRCVRALGADLAANNYHGVFGVDFVLAGDGPVVIEVNPRMVASLPVATELEVEAGRAPLLLLHLLELSGADVGVIDERVEQPLPDASLVILHRLPGDSDAPPRGGVYRVTPAEGPEFLRPGAGIADLAGDDELLLVSRRQGEPVTDRKEFARIYRRSAQAEGSSAVRSLADLVRQGRR